ncbi:MAG: right-handed parallel beta-helix repeat-containing protein, partial [Planctomycetota bacterium]
MRWLMVTSLIFVFSVIGFSATLDVPTAAYPTIQSAINAAAWVGDTVRVAPGTYMENIDFSGKAVMVKSSDGAYVTVIDGGQLRSVVTFDKGEGAGSVLDGFTIRNGSGTIINGYQACGGGIFCDNASSPTIINNEIVTNVVQYYGGGIYCQYGSSPLIKGNLVMENLSQDDGAGIACWFDSNAHITDNRILFNHAFGGGGGIDCWDSDVIVTDNMIAHNDSLNSSGGGMRAVSYANPVITSNTFCENFAAGSGGGIAGMSYTNLKIYNCIFWDDMAPTIPEIYLWNFSTASVNFSNVAGGYAGPGNIALPPMFVSQPAC